MIFSLSELELEIRICHSENEKKNEPKECFHVGNSRW